jgi:hypothetical protein
VSGKPRRAGAQRSQAEGLATAASYRISLAGTPNNSAGALDNPAGALSNPAALLNNPAALLNNPAALLNNPAGALRDLICDWKLKNSPCGHFKNQQSTIVTHQSICVCRRKDAALGDSSCKNLGATGNPAFSACQILSLPPLS